jgi:2-methylisocitrate lyase-like PEP mutase family enzyme
MSETTLQGRAAALLAMHRPGNPVVLPTVWDAWSARLAVGEGFSALTVGSHPLADSIGKADGEVMSFDDLLTRVRQITDAVDVPVSVDIESGYGEPPERLIAGLLDVGAVGFNLEDTVHKEGKRLRSPAEHAELVGRLRAAADAAGVHVVINARTDLFLRNGTDERSREESISTDERSREESISTDERSREESISTDDADRVDRAIARLSEAAAAGADSLFPAGLRDPEGLARFVSEVPLPVSVTVPPDSADLAELAAIGVGRITFGPFLQAALSARAKEVLGRWR